MVTNLIEEVFIKTTAMPLYGQLAGKPTRRQPSRRQTNSPTVQLADTPTLRQTNLPKLIYGRFGTRRNPVESMKVALPAG